MEQNFSPETGQSRGPRRRGNRCSGRRMARPARCRSTMSPWGTRSRSLGISSGRSSWQMTHFSGSWALMSATRPWWAVSLSCGLAVAAMAGQAAQLAVGRHYRLGLDQIASRQCSGLQRWPAVPPAKSGSRGSRPTCALAVGNGRHRGRRLDRGGTQGVGRRLQHQPQHDGQPGQRQADGDDGPPWPLSDSAKTEFLTHCSPLRGSNRAGRYPASATPRSNRDGRGHDQVAHEQASDHDPRS